MRSLCPQAGKKGMTSARLSELCQKVLREALDGVPCAVPWSVPESHSDILSSLSLTAESAESVLSVGQREPSVSHRLQRAAKGVCL